MTSLRKIMGKFLPFGIFVGLIVVLFLGLYDDDSSGLPSSLIDQPLPSFVLDSLLPSESQGFSSHDFVQGHPILLNIWASWCAPCRVEHPVLMKLAQEGIVIYGMNYKDSLKASRRFLDHLGNPYHRVGVDNTGQTAIHLGIYGVPETFLISGTGHIIFRHAGPLTEEIFEQKFRPFFQR